MFVALQPWGRKVAPGEKHGKKKLAVKPVKATCDADSSRRLSRPWSYVNRPKTKRIALMARSNSAGVILASGLGDSMTPRLDSEAVREVSNEDTPLNRHLSVHSNSSSSTSTSSNMDVSWDVGTSLEDIVADGCAHQIGDERRQEEGRSTQSVPITIPSKPPTGGVADFRLYASVNSGVTMSRVVSPKWAHSPIQQRIAQTRHPKLLLAQCRPSRVTRKGSTEGHHTQLSLPSTTDAPEPETASRTRGDSTDDASDSGDVTRAPRTALSRQGTAPSRCVCVTADHDLLTCSCCQQPYVLCSDCHQQVTCAVVPDANKGLSRSCPLPSHMDDHRSSMGQGDARWDRSSPMTSLDDTHKLLGDRHNVCHSCGDIRKLGVWPVDSFAMRRQKKEKTLSNGIAKCRQLSGDDTDRTSQTQGSQVVPEPKRIQTASAEEQWSPAPTSVVNVSSGINRRRQPSGECVSSDEEALCRSDRSHLNGRSTYTRHGETSDVARRNMKRRLSPSDIVKQSSHVRSYSDDALQCTKNDLAPEPNRRKFKTFAAAAKELIRQKTQSAFSLLVSSLRKPGGRRKSYRLSASADALVEGHRHGSKSSFGFLSLRQQTSPSVRLNYLRRLFSSQGHQPAVEDDAVTCLDTNTDCGSYIESVDVSHKTEYLSGGDYRRVSTSTDVTPKMSNIYSGDTANIIDIIGWHGDTPSVSEVVSLNNDIVKTSCIDSSGDEGYKETRSLTDTGQFSSGQSCGHLTKSCDKLPDGLEVEEALCSNIIQETVL